MLRFLKLLAVAALSVAAVPLPAGAQDLAPARQEDRLSAAVRATDADGDRVTEALERELDARIAAAGTGTEVDVIVLLGDTLDDQAVAAARAAVPSLRDVELFEQGDAFTARPK